MATAYFLDTNILVHLIRRDALGQYLTGHYTLYVVEPRPMISDVTEGELSSLASQWGWGRAEARADGISARLLLAHCHQYAGRV
jgi:hypothetical protein